jgi:hypothetical protein
MECQTAAHFVRASLQLNGAPETIGIGNKGGYMVDGSLESGGVVSLTVRHDQYSFNGWDGQL